MKCRAAKRKHLDTFVIMHSGCETPNQRLLESQHGKFVGRSLVNPYWIKTEGVRLAIIPRPRGQDWLPDDISLLQRAGIATPSASSGLIMRGPQPRAAFASREPCRSELNRKSPKERVT